MSFEATCLYNVAEEGSGKILDYAYLESEEVIYVVFITDTHNIAVYFDTRGDGGRVSIPISDIFPEHTEAQLVCLLPDALGILLYVPMDTFVVIPLKRIVTHPRISQDGSNEIYSFKISTKGKAELKYVTAIQTYKSSLTKQNFLLFGQKNGNVNIVDLGCKKLVAVIPLKETIRDLEIHIEHDPKKVYVIASLLTGVTTVIPLETETIGHRELLAHKDTWPISEFKQYPYQITARNARKQLTLYDSDDKTFQLRLLDKIDVIATFRNKKVPSDAWKTFYSDHVMAFVTGEREVTLGFVFDDTSEFERLELNVGLPNVPLGFVPTHPLDKQLYSCILVTSNGLFHLSCGLDVADLSFRILINHLYEKKQFVKMCEVFSFDHWTLFETCIYLALAREDSADVINGLMFLALELHFELEIIFDILKESNNAHLMIPFLSLRCDHNPRDNDIVTLLWKNYAILTQTTPDEEMPALENTIFNFLTFNDPGPKGVEIMLKNSFLSCVHLFLIRNPYDLSHSVIHYFIISLDWATVNRMDLLRCFNHIQWSAVELRTKTKVLRKLCLFVEKLKELHQIVVLLNMAMENLEDSLFSDLALVCSAKCDHLLQCWKKSIIKIKWKPYAFGPNIAAIFADDRSLWVWGLFVSGDLKPVNEYIKRMRKRKSKEKIVVKLKSEPNAPLFKLTKFPRRLELPKEVTNDEIGVCMVECGAEHILILDSLGRVYSYGRNTFGQCGLNHTNYVTEFTKIDGLKAKIKRIVAGHYHSILITEFDEVVTFGWGIHGQLGQHTIENVIRPAEVHSLIDIPIVEACGGSAHSLAMVGKGEILGTGYMGHGELIYDPSEARKFDKKERTWQWMLLELEESIKLMSSNYFQGLALSFNQMLYLWGASPAQIKSKGLLNKKGKGKQGSPSPKKQSSAAPSSSTACTSSSTPSKIPTLQTKPSSSKPSTSATPMYGPLNPADSPATFASSLEHIDDNGGNVKTKFQYNWFKLLDWSKNNDKIVQISCGYSHSGFLTAAGRIYLFGKGLERQLGTGLKSVKTDPVQMTEPNLKWKYLSCGLKNTAAITVRGEAFVWGRNDRNQIGVRQPYVPADERELIQRHTFASPNTGKDTVLELPIPQAIKHPTPIFPLTVAVHHSALFDSGFKKRCKGIMDTASRSSLMSASEALRKTTGYQAIKIKLLAGDLISTAESLGHLYNSYTYSQNSNIIETAHLPDPLTLPSFLTAIFQHSLTENDAELLKENFNELFDLFWLQMMAHPQTRARCLCCMILLVFKVPIYNRLGQDKRLCVHLAGLLRFPCVAEVPEQKVSTIRTSSSSKTSQMESPNEPSTSSANVVSQPSVSLGVSAEPATSKTTSHSLEPSEPKSPEDKGSSPSTSNPLPESQSTSSSSELSTDPCDLQKESLVTSKGTSTKAPVTLKSSKTVGTRYCSVPKTNKNRMNELDVKGRVELLQSAQLPGANDFDELYNEIRDESTTHFYYSNCEHFELQPDPSFALSLLFASCDRERVCARCAIKRN